MDQRVPYTVDPDGFILDPSEAAVAKMVAMSGHFEAVEVLDPEPEPTTEPEPEVLIPDPPAPVEQTEPVDTFDLDGADRSALKAKAKELGIKVGRMKTETIRERIREALPE